MEEVSGNFFDQDVAGCGVVSWYWVSVNTTRSVKDL